MRNISFKYIDECCRVYLIPVRNYLDDSYRYTFGGKEAQPELGLNWLDFHARNYDAALGRWMNVDPLAEKYLSWSPYNYTMNNPINMIDPTGMAAEWIPKVNNDGSISYIAEDGDNASTLKSQYGLDKNIAEDLYSTMEEGEITGESVANITESEVLTLDLKSDLASDQRVFDQFMFAMDHSQSQNKSGFYTTEYFSNVFNQNSRFREGFANLNINGRNIKVNYQLPLYETQGVIFNVNLFPYFLSNTTETSYIRYGNMFGNNYESISHQFLPLSLSFGKGLKNLKSQGYYRISTSSQNDRLLNHRLNNK